MSASSSTSRMTQSRKIHRTVLQNGLTVVAVENSAADIVSSRILINGGSRFERPGKDGVSHLMAAVLTKGTDYLSSQDIAEKVESIGASLGTDATTDYCLVGLKTVASDFSDVLKLAAEIVRSPSFPEHEVELERRLTLQGIRSMREQPFSVAYQNLRSLIYGDHPYGESGLGTEATLAEMTRDDLWTYYRDVFRPEEMVVSIVGRIDPEAAIAQVEAVFGDWTPTSAEGVDSSTQNPYRPQSLEVVPPTSQPQLTVDVQETMQAIVMLGYPAASVHSSDYTALKVLSTHLGNGLSSRLFVELREKLGLAYDVSAIYPTRVDLSHFVAYMGTAPVNVETAIHGLQKEIDRICHQALTPGELQIAKNKLLGQYALGKQTNAQMAQLYGWYEVLGLGIDFDQTFQDTVANLTAEEILNTASQHFSAPPYLSFVGPHDAASMLNQSAE
ncbi:MAG: pitrilysin family protein [Leptolyngbyaceae bacterium]|nr:pitrilysin family protein [Leptolyngbyaceae bacterium]